MQRARQLKLSISILPLLLLVAACGPSRRAPEFEVNISMNKTSPKPSDVIVVGTKSED